MKKISAVELLDYASNKTLKKFFNKWFVKRILNERFRALCSFFKRWKCVFEYEKRLIYDELLKEKLQQAKKLPSSSQSIPLHQSSSFQQTERTDEEKNFIKDLLQHVTTYLPQLNQLKTPQIDKLCCEVIFQTITKNTILFVQSSHITYAYILISGSCDLYYQHEEQREAQLLRMDFNERERLFDRSELKLGNYMKTLTGPEILGDMALLSQKNAKRSCTAVVAENTSLLVIHKSTYTSTMTDVRAPVTYIQMAVDFLSECLLFQECPPAKVKDIAFGMNFHNKTLIGTLLAYSGEPISNVFLILRGEVTAYADIKSDNDRRDSTEIVPIGVSPLAHHMQLVNSGKRIPVARVGHGMIIGEREFTKKLEHFELSYVTHSASVVVGVMDAAVYWTNCSLDSKALLRKATTIQQISDQARSQLLSASKRRLERLPSLPSMPGVRPSSSEFTRTSINSFSAQGEDYISTDRPWTSPDRRRREERTHSSHKRDVTPPSRNHSFKLYGGMVASPSLGLGSSLCDSASALSSKVSPRVLDNTIPPLLDSNRSQSPYTEPADSFARLLITGEATDVPVPVQTELSFKSSQSADNDLVTSRTASRSESSSTIKLQPIQHLCSTQSMPGFSSTYLFTEPPSQYSLGGDEDRAWQMGMRSTMRPKKSKFLTAVVKSNKAKPTSTIPTLEEYHQINLSMDSTIENMIDTINEKKKANRSPKKEKPLKTKTEKFLLTSRQSGGGNEANIFWIS